MVGFFYQMVFVVSYGLPTRTAAAVGLADHDWLGAVNDGLRVVGRAHLLVGLHVDGLRPGIHDRGARIVDRGGGDIRGNGVNRRAGGPALVVVKPGAGAELETPRSGMGYGAESEGGGDGGEEDEFFHGWWWLNFRRNPMRWNPARQIGGIEYQCLAVVFLAAGHGIFAVQPANTTARQVCEKRSFFQQRRAFQRSSRRFRMPSNSCTRCLVRFITALALQGIHIVPSILE